MERWFQNLRACGGPVGRPLLVLSDIHGDLAALDAVLAQVQDIDLCGIVALGDHCVGGPDPLGVWLRLQERRATLTRGESDWALGMLASVSASASDARRAVDDDKDLDPDEQRRLQEFIAAREALGDILCRRLAELPSTAVVSLDDRSGVMAMHSLPKSSHRADPTQGPDAPDDAFDSDCSCIAEDVLVLGRSHVAFVRRRGSLLVVGAGSVGDSAVQTDAGDRTAHAALLLPFHDGVIRVAPRDIVVEDAAQKDADDVADDETLAQVG